MMRFASILAWLTLRQPIFSPSTTPSNSTSSPDFRMTLSISVAFSGYEYKEAKQTKQTLAAFILYET